MSIRETVIQACYADMVSDLHSWVRTGNDLRSLMTTSLPFEEFSRSQLIRHLIDSRGDRPTWDEIKQLSDSF